MRLPLLRFVAPLACLALFVPALVSARITDANTGLSATAQAAQLSSGCTGSATACIATMLGRILNVLFGFLGIVLLGYVLYGGFVWMTASGGKEVEQAQGIIRNAVIGVIIIACSFAISNFALTQVGVIAGFDTTGAGGTGADGDSSLNAISDGATRACCYGNPAPAASCLADCQRTPTAFGLAAGATVTSCTAACGSRICTAGRSDDPKPVAGQLQCTPGAPSATGGLTPTDTGVCSSFLSTPLPIDACNNCVAQCQRETICNSNPFNNVGRIPSGSATTEALSAQRGQCQIICQAPSGGAPAPCSR